jgi:hypothetical protein
MSAPLVDETDILHEYFIPRAAYAPFIAEAREILRNQSLPVLNASVRIVHKEDVALNYAPDQLIRWCSTSTSPLMPTAMPGCAT